MSRVAIIAALAGELQPLVRGWRREARGGVELWRRGTAEGEWIAACAGIGAAAAARTWSEIERTGAIDRVFSVGWAGALRAEFAVGRAYCLGGVIDGRNGDRFAAVGPSAEGWLVTGTRVADPGEKRRLAAVFGADLVDMEAAAVARLAAQRQIPFTCIKGVSDGWADRMPDFTAFISETGEFQRGRFILFTLLHPWCWRSVARLGRNSRTAARAISELLGAALDRPGSPSRR